MPTSDSESGGSKVIQIANVSPQATRDQLYTMCSFLGRVLELKMYPLESNPNFTSYDRKVCYVRFEDSNSVAVAQHLTNTVFIDRALMCVPLADGVIPEEETALKQGVPGLSGQRKLPAGVVNQIQTMGSQQVIVTVDPNLNAAGLPPYPPLPANTDAGRVEEIRRTAYVGGIPLDAEPQEVLDFINEKIGEVMYLRFAGDDSQASRNAYVEFSQIASVAAALSSSGQLEMKGSPLKFQHASQAVAKPTAKTAEAAQREVEEAMRKTNAAQSLISRAVDLDVGKSRSRSPRSSSGLRMRSNSRRSRSRSRERRRSRSRSKSWGRYRRSWRSSGYSADTLIQESLDRKFDTGSRSRHRSRSQSRSRRKKSRSRSADRKRSKRSSRSRSRDKEKKTKLDKKELKDDRREASKSSSSRSKREEKRKTPERKVEKSDERKKKKEKDRKSRSKSRDRKSHRSKKDKEQQSPSAKRSKKDKKRRDSSEDSERKKEKTKSKGKREKRSHSKEDLSSPDKGPNVSTASNVSAEGKKEKLNVIDERDQKLKVGAEINLEEAKDDEDLSPTKADSPTAAPLDKVESDEEEKLRRSVTSPSPNPKKPSKAKKYRKASKSSSEDSDSDSSDTDSD